MMRQSTGKANSVESQVGVTHLIHIISYRKEIWKRWIKESKIKLFINNFPHNVIYSFKPLLNYFTFFITIFL